MSLFNVYPRFDIAIERGEGVYIYDQQGIKYLDLYGGHGVISIGHSHPHYIQSIKNQLERIGFYSNSVQLPLQKELADKLAAISGYPCHNLFFCNSGAEANENALKLASFHTNKKKVIAFKGSFHGRTAATLNVTDNPRLSAPINQGNFDVDFIALNDEEALITALETNTVCAVIIEGIQGVGGLDMATIGYFQFLEAACKKYKALLILDEIQAGYARTGRFFAHQHAGITADIITTAKGMGNGFPIAGVLINPEIEAKFGLLGTTFGGNHLACAAGIAVLDSIRDEKLMENVNIIHSFLIRELKLIPAIKNIKGLGLMLGIEFDFPIAKLRKELLEKHHIFTGASANPNLLRILPPLTITQAEINPFLNSLKSLLA
ncbi:MAG: acetylornithine/N-succinyldiaminopimelate aminotransferase [Crocinitomix sp.]|jgi:acetylornithine/N-succinyldiaminopimelate aminotransferase